MSDYPGWTERGFGAEDHGGRWALGLEPMGFRMTRLLLPAITNATRRVRYFSFLAWVFWTFQEHLRRTGKSSTTATEQGLWRRRLENAWRAASLYRGAHDGLVGERSAARLPEGAALFSLDQKDPANAWRADTYRSAWLGLNLGHIEDRVAVLHPYPGERLARAFDVTIRRTDAGRGLRERLLEGGDAVPADVVRALAPALSLSAVPEQSPEHVPLIDTLFRLSDENEPAMVERRSAVRRRSLALLLDMLAQSEGSLAGESDIHRVLALASFPDGRPYAPAPALVEIFRAWRCYQLREQEKLALYGFWEEVLRAIRLSPNSRASSTQLISWVLDAVRISAVARHWLGNNALDLTVAEALDRVPRDDAARERLAHEMSEKLLDLEDPDHPGAATVLLLAVCSRWRALSSSLPEGTRKLFDGAETELPPPLLSAQLFARAGERLGSLVSWGLERWVLAQSLAIALQKWRRGEDRFFIARDQDGYQIVKDHPSSNYLVFDRPRIWSSLQLLRDLQLVRMEGALITTALGEDICSRALDVEQQRASSGGST